MYEQKKSLLVRQNKKGLIAYVNTVRLDATKHEDTEKTEVRKYVPSLSQERAGRCEP